jgi:hypothetical protein
MNKNYLLIYLFIFSFFFTENPIFSAENDVNHCKITAPSKISIKPGKTVNVPIKFKLDKSWHIYGFVAAINKEGIGPQQTDIYYNDTTGTITPGKPSYPKPKTKYDDAFEMDVDSYSGSFTCTLPLTAKSDAAKSCITMPLEITYQLCDGNMCLPPTTVPIPFNIIIQ